MVIYLLLLYPIVLSFGFIWSYSVVDIIYYGKTRRINTYALYALLAMLVLLVLDTFFSQFLFKMFNK